MSRVDDFDVLPALSFGWSQSHTQLGRGRPDVRLTMASTPSCELAVIRREPGVLLQGSPPRGKLVLSLNVDGNALHLQRRHWALDLLGVVPAGGEFEVISTTPHTLFGLCLDPELLDEAALAHWGHPFPTGNSGPRLRFRDAVSRQRVVRTWAAWLHRARRQPGMFQDPGVVAIMEEEVVGVALANVEPTVRCAPVHPHRDLALRAEAFLRNSLDEPVRIVDVCAAVRTSRPSLHASFHQAFGTSPMAYRKSLRLSAAQADLRRARRGTTVVAIATKWGFFRFGHFSRDYRAMFGENPSETIQHAVARGSPGRGARPGPSDPFP